MRTMWVLHVCTVCVVPLPPLLLHQHQVVVGVTDPNPLVGGQGIATLRNAGIEVELVGGDEEAQCFEINKEFMLRMQQEATGGQA